MASSRSPAVSRGERELEQLTASHTQPEGYPDKRLAKRLCQRDCDAFAGYRNTRRTDNPFDG
jgi:hypothetical protein